jgi:hypothetical protein
MTHIMAPLVSKMPSGGRMKQIGSSNKAHWSRGLVFTRKKIRDPVGPLHSNTNSLSGPPFLLDMFSRTVCPRTKTKMNKKSTAPLLHEEKSFFHGQAVSASLVGIARDWYVGNFAHGGRALTQT